MNQEEKNTSLNPRRAFFKKIAAAVAGTVAAGGVLPKALRPGEKKVEAKPHPEAVKRTR